MTADLINTGILQGLILAMISYGIMISFRLLSFADLTAEGSYPLGGAICASLIVSGCHPIIAVLASTLAGGFMSIGTSLIHLKFKIDSLLAGIILSTMAYSVSLRIMGKPNIPLFAYNNFLSSDTTNRVITLLVIIAICVLLLSFFLKTDFGLRLRAVGLSSVFASKQGCSVIHYTVLGLFISGCFFGLAGGLIVQIQQYMDIGMGVGIVIHALASLMIGEAILVNDTLNKQLLAPLVGAIIYQQIQGFVLFLGLAPSDLKFFTAAVVLLVIALQNKKRS